MSNAPAPIDFQEVEEQPQFRALKRKHRSLVLPLSVIFFLWYFVYVLLGAYAHDFMATPVIGNINLGIVLGLSQFVTTFAITMIYVRFANRSIDPAANDIRLALEKRAEALGTDPATASGAASDAPPATASGAETPGEETR